MLVPVPAARSPPVMAVAVVMAVAARPIVVAVAEVKMKAHVRRTGEDGWCRNIHGRRRRVVRGGRGVVAVVSRGADDHLGWKGHFEPEMKIHSGPGGRRGSQQHSGKEK